MEKAGSYLPMIKIFLVDTQPSVRKGLQMRMALENDLLVVGEAGDGPSAVQQIAELEPDVILLDLDMQEMDGFATLQAIRSGGIAIPVVILSIQDDPVSRQRAYALGATDFVEKRVGAGELVATIRRHAA
jgi:DNA-binding NarL/FixJ family response regulator